MAENMNDLTPISYKIRLEPDLGRANFLGSVEILLEASNLVSEVILNALELAFWSCKIEVGGVFLDCPYYVDPGKEELKIVFTKVMAGKIRLWINYAGELNDKMAGFYRSKHVTGDTEKYIAVTQFQESDARRAFPCFDHPVKKATFDVEMIVDQGLVAISNGPVAEEKPLGNGKKLVRFQQTPKMSTYLLFFGVGEFEFIEDPGEVVVRAATMPGMTKYAGLGLDFGRKSLEFCDAYYGIKYPLPKLDLIAVPDFAAGAMENWGAITFRENLLLYYPNITSRAGEERICEVIAHEVVHQWFGNLVSPSDWKYLWLNESFATYFGYGVVMHYYPEWEIWGQFLHGQTDEAFERDALRETVPIEIPGGEHVVINASTAPIIYNKGGSILRHIEGYIGIDNFKAGLRRYFKKHEYACASSHHLWEALEEASEKPITKMMKSWIEQPGFPIVEVRRAGKSKLIFSQKRFTYLPSESDQEWLVPITVKVFYNHRDAEEITTLLESKDTSIDICGDAIAYKVNYGQTGFYRVRYCEKGNLVELGKRVLNKELPAEDRWGIQNDLYALVKSGDVSIDDYLDFLSNYENEDTFLPLTSIADNLFQAHLVMEEAKKEKVASIGRPFLDKVLSNIGCEPSPEEKHTTSILRDQIMWQSVVYGLKKAEKFALARFSSLISGGEIHPDIIKSVMQVGALNGDDEVFEWFDERLKTSESEHERINILVALGSFRDKALIERVQRYVLEEVPDRNRFVPICRMAANPYAIPYMWEWFLSNLSRLEKLHPVHYERVIGAIIPVCGIKREEEVRAFFQDYIKKEVKTKEIIRLSLEKLEVNLRMTAS